MTKAATHLTAKNPNIPLPAALLAAGGVAALFVWLKSPRATELAISRIAIFWEINSRPLLVLATLLLGNIVWIGVAAKQHAKILREHGGHLQEAELDRGQSIIAIITHRLAAYVLAGALGWYLAADALAIRGLALLPIAVTAEHFHR